jgi:hypothetical protein
VFESERVVPGSFVTSKVDVSSSDEYEVELRTTPRGSKYQYCSQHERIEAFWGKERICETLVTHPGAAGLLMVIGPSLFWGIDGRL